MKHPAFLALILVFSMNSFAQKTPIINIGAGLPIFFGQKFSDPGYGPLNLQERIHLFVEKPISLGSDRKLSLNPGFGYFLFNESYESGGLGQHYYRQLTHYSYSIYSRFFYHFTINPEKSNHYYCGITGGKYIYTKSAGDASWYRLQESQDIGGNEVIDDNGRSFFHSFYYGIIGGFIGKTTKNSLLAPAFEFSYFPEFLTLNDKRRWMAMFSVILKINKKKSYLKSE